jgi:phosphate transport system permease protein
VIDLLAAVPSVVFGLWGARVLGPYLVTGHQWLDDNLGFIPFFKGPASVTGKTILTAGVVLAIMILPIVTAICREIFAQTPRLHEEAALALGATKWETIRYAVFPYARSGMVSAVMLGLGRALGETMAVAMVLSASPVVTLNMISNTNPATIASNIASSFAEATPAKLSVLIATGLVLFAFTFAVNFAARAVVARSDRKLSR